MTISPRASALAGIAVTGLLVIALLLAEGVVLGLIALVLVAFAGAAALASLILHGYNR